ncbi:CHAT domain-containing protein [Polyangium mundeleinium]|uniref:CHAT domain-containing protein n=1 Tax=Polyangium mundeleinium TaxID=2995306 RepID=A0ABT5ET11_9BACT|nr:CHAT domain-containing protein [Polyangium mundeleinium]MDC0744961.1 CHAT domain-containing protein [Polyangium mundeleinium]
MPPVEGPVTEYTGRALPDQALGELFRHADERERAQDFEAALEAYAAMLQSLLDGGRIVPEHLCDRIARCCSRLGQPRTAVRLLVTTRKRMQALGHAYGVFHANLRLAETCIEAVELASAEKFLADAVLGRPEPLESQGRTPAALIEQIHALTWPGTSAEETTKAHVEAWLVVARYWAAIGHFAPAIEATKRARGAVRQARLPGKFFSAPDIDVSLVELCLDRGDVAAAEEIEEEARAHPFKGTGPHPDETPWLALAARRAGLQGRLSDARRSLDRLVDQRRGPPTRRDAWITLFHAGLLAQLNRLAEAERVLDDFEARLDGGPVHAALRREVASRRQAIQDKRSDASQEEGLPFVPEQVLEGEEEAPHAEPGQTRPAATSLGGTTARQKERFTDEWALGANRVLVALAAGRLEEAFDRLSALEDLAAGTDAPRIRTRTRYYRALFDHARGAYATARDALLPCIDEAAAQGLPLDRLQYLERLMWTFARLGAAGEYAGRAAEAKALLDTLTSTLDHDDRVFWMLNRMSRQDEFVAARITSLSSIQPPSSPLLPIGAMLHRFRLRRETLARYREVACLSGWSIDRTLSASTEAPAPVLSAVPPELATESHQIEAWVRAQLELSRRTTGARTTRTVFLDRFLPLRRIPRKVAIVHYYAVADRLFVFVLSRGHISVTILPTTRVELYEAVRDVLSEIVQQWQARIGDRRVLQALRRLSKGMGVDQILGPLAGSIEHVILVPHDVLIHAPFAALLCGEQRLCELFTLSIAPGVGFVDLANVPGRRRALPGRFLGVAVREYPGTSWKPLPGAIAEVERVAALVPGSGAATLLTGAAAQPKAILDALDEAEIVHWACHGMFDRDQPHRSRLLVSGPEGTTGEVTLADIQVRGLHRLELVILACCWTASAAVLPGHEVVCLPAAFLRAGAGAAIAPLWEVDDAMSGEFMVDLYRAAARWPSARALAEVQRSWLKEDARGRGMAFHWAAHVHYGQGA